MRAWFLAVVPALGLVAGDAYAGAECLDACTSFFGAPACFLSGGLGCVIPPTQATGQCGICSTNQHCAPFGTCVGGTCINTNCAADGGQADAVPFDSGTTPDAGDVGPIEAGTDAGDDGGGADAASADVGPLDTGFRPDAMFSGGGGGGGPPRAAPIREQEDKCGCSMTSSERPSAWGLLGLGLLALRRRR